jgi:hypothetical protein
MHWRMGPRILLILAAGGLGSCSYEPANLPGAPTMADAGSRPDTSVDTELSSRGEPADAPAELPPPVDARVPEPGSGPDPIPAPVDGRPLDPDAAPPPPPDARPPSAPDAAAPAPPACRGIDDCATGHNCFGGRCEPAPLNCNALKTDQPGAGDGVYWIQGGPVPTRVYCDMRERLELCSEREEEHKGFGRDPSHIHFVMRSVLDLTAGVCKVWALRSVNGSWPLDELSRSDPARAIDTCQMLGFKATARLGQCLFGNMGGSYSDCGFGASNFLRWGSLCPSCQQNPGEFDRYVLQGPIFRGTVLSNTFGTVATTCRVR